MIDLFPLFDRISSSKGTVSDKIEWKMKIMRNYKLTISYDGSKYQGWQRQVNTNATIQWILEWTIGKMIGYQVEVHGSGRTDSGVHARGQVAHMMLAGKVDEEEFLQSLNRHLPEDIKVVKMELMKNSFHARKSAHAKRYAYLIDQREKPDVFTRRYFYHFPKELDIEAMEEAAGYLIGRHDFTSFTDKKEAVSMVRSIYEITIEKEADKIGIFYHGSGFLYHMVRILTGTLLEVGIGERKAEEIPAILAAKERSLAGFLAPARGLVLQEVYYE